MSSEEVSPANHWEVNKAIGATGFAVTGPCVIREPSPS